MAEHCRNTAEIVQYLVLIYSTDSWEIFSFVLLKKNVFFFPLHQQRWSYLTVQLFHNPREALTQGIDFPCSQRAGDKQHSAPHSQADRRKQRLECAIP